jgi:hypothetical protein
MDNTEDIYISNDFSCQVDPLLQLGLDRSSLDLLRKIIAEIKGRNGNDTAYEVTRWLADPIILSQFINTIFLNATNGYVQFRMFVDGEDKKPWGYPWKAAPVSDRGLLLHWATTLASQAALSVDKVNFCPPVCTLIGPDKARIEDTCEGVAIMVECDHQPVLSQQALVYVLDTPTLVIKSGGVWIDPETGEQQDKVHLYWRLAQPTRESADHDKLREARELASLIVSSDPTAKPPVHPLRWPGSWHKKGDPRLAQIAEINHEVEIELDHALAKLHETAREFGIATTRQEERAKTAPPPLTNLRRDVEWKYDHIMDGYRTLSHGRHHALSVLAVSLAMSALNTGYNIEAHELQDLLAQAQRDNPPSSRYNEKELAHLAETSIPIAHDRVGDGAAYKKKAEAEARWEAEEARIRREIEEMDAEGEALSSRLGGDAGGAMNGEPPYDDDDEPEEDWRSAYPEVATEGVPDAPRQQQPKQRKTRFRSRAESRDLPPPVYLVQDLIEDGADAVIYGDSESLKSFFALAIGGSLATGIPAFGKFEIPNQGVVFYFAAEGKNNMEKKRLTAWEVDNGFAPFSVEDVWIGDAAFMIDDKDVEECILDIEYHLSDRKGKVPVLFVIDTLSRALNGQDEDKANVAAKYLNNVKKIKDRIGGTSLTVAHTGKDRARGLRGSSGYFAGFDTVLAVDTNQDPDTLLHTSELTVEKQKDGITGVHYWFQSREVEIPTGKSLVLDPISDEDGKKDMTKKKPMNVNDVHSAIKSLAPNGSPLTKRQVATKVAAMMGITIDGAEKALDRHKDKDNDPYKIYRDGDKFHFPSSMKGADQTIADQIKELRDDETRRIRQSIQEQMDGIFPNGKSVN